MLAMQEKVFTPLKSGFLDVSDGYKIRYAQFGNPQGKPILFLHGGPGGGGYESEIYNLNFFDLSQWNIITFDQRGAGQSTPFASVENNTTQKIIEDIDKLLKLFSIDRIFLYGGSWGSALSLFYAIQNPQRITGILVRGIYLGSSSDNYHLINGPIKYNFPENWERFMNLVPANQQQDALSYYLDKILHGTENEKDKYAYDFDLYESAFLTMNPTPGKIEKDMSNGAYRSFAPIEATYMLNLCFMPDNYILNNAHKLSNIPVTIIHGRYDFICPPANAWNLHKTIQNSKLKFVYGAHSAREDDMQKLITDELSIMVK